MINNKKLKENGIENKIKFKKLIKIKQKGIKKKEQNQKEN